MKIVSPSVEILTNIDPDALLQHLELCARTCYKSEDKITTGSAQKLIHALIKNGHEAAIEHFSITVKFICDRAVQNEIVRHRVASYCVESTRYCDYTSGKFGGELTFIEPCFWAEDPEKMTAWISAMNNAELSYKALIERGAKPEEARDVLPMSLKSEVIMTANMREWRHFLKLRTSRAAHPQIRQLANILLGLFKGNLPVLFDDIEVSE